MAVTGAALFEQGTVDPISVPAIKRAALAVAIDTIPLDIFEMRPEGGLAHALTGPCNVDLHHDTAHTEFRVRCLPEKTCPSRAASTRDLRPAEGRLAGL